MMASHYKHGLLPNLLVTSAFNCLCVPVWAYGTEQSPINSVEVIGRQTSGSYHASESSSSKTSLNLRELPQAIRVMTRQSLDDLGATRIDDALDFVGGVSRQNNFGGLWDNIAIRGLAGDVNNGMALLQNGFAANRGFNAPRDTSNIERIEFLKGPIAAMYGSSEPGGTLNIINKSPLWRSGHAAEVYLGSDQLRRVSIDSTGPLNANFAYRLNAALENKHSMRDFYYSERQFVAPALLWQFDSNTQINYKAEYLQQKAPLDRGVVAFGTQLGKLPLSRFLGEPSDGPISVNNQTQQLHFDHQFNEHWQVRFGIAYKNNQMSGYSSEAQPTLQADNQTLRRQRRYRDYRSDDWTLQAELQHQFVTGSSRHELLISAETYRFDSTQLMQRINPTNTAPYAINVLNPVYGQIQPQPLANTHTQEQQSNQAVYLQDAISLGETWRLITGVRMDRYQQDLLNLRNRVLTRQSPQSTSPRVALSYLVNPEWSLFLNWGRSFRPNNGSDAAGRAFNPERGIAKEGGVKWQSRDARIGATLSFFSIDKTSVLTNDVANPGYSVTAGAVKSQGMEFDLTGQITPDWRINAALAYTDAKVVRDANLEIGRELLNVPRLNGSLMLVHEQSLGQYGKLGLGGAISYSSKRLGEGRTQSQVQIGELPFYLPAYSTVKLMAFWRISPTLRFSLDLDNLLDREFYTTSYQRTWITPGNHRSVQLGMQARF